MEERIHGGASDAVDFEGGTSDVIVRSVENEQGNGCGAVEPGVDEEEG